MTVAEAGTHEGSLQEVVRESGLDTDAPVIEFTTIRGRINADLTVGVDVTDCHATSGERRPVFARCEAARHRLHRDARTSEGARASGTDQDWRTTSASYRNGRDLTSRHVE